MLFSARDRFRGQSGTFRVVECTDCGLVLITPVPTLDPFILNLEWIRDNDPQSIFRRLINWGHRLAARRAASLVQRCSASGASVLDFSGVDLSSALRERGLAVVASAPRANPVASLLKARGVPIVQGSLPEGCFQSGAFDVIVSSHVLEHQRDPRLAINAMLEMLHSDGCLVIHVPNANSWQAVLLAGTWAGFDIPRHPVTFDSTSLERLLASCGLSVGIRKPCSVIEAAFCLTTSLCPSLDPDLRQLRGLEEHRIVDEFKNLCYCLLSIALLPLVLLEYASGSSPAILVEARRTTETTTGSNERNGNDHELNRSNRAVNSKEPIRP